MYGSNIDENGKELRATGTMPLLTGERVPGHKIEGLFKAKDQNGEEIADRWELHFRQSNGKLFTHTLFASDQAWAIAATNRTLLHICTRIVTEAEYYAAVANNTGFDDFMMKIRDKILSKVGDKTFTLKIVYQQDKNTLKWYGKFPKFPNFIELDGTSPSTLKTTDPRYDIYEIPSEASAPAAGTPASVPSADVF